MHATKVGQILSLFITEKKSKIPAKMQNIEVDENGILLDKHYNKDIDRSILITSIDSYKLAEKHNIDMQAGALGENLLIDYYPYDLDIGTKLQIGTALLEISQPCTLCNHLSSIDKRVPKLLKNDRGIFAKVIRSGVIKEGDDIYLIG